MQGVIPAWDRDLPYWWTLEHFPNDTYTLTRVDGVELSAYKTGMGFWGWCISEGGEHFEGVFPEALVETAEDGTERLLPKIVEGGMVYPNPVTFLADLDRHYPVES